MIKKSFPLSRVYSLLEPGPVVMVTTSYPRFPGDGVGSFIPVGHFDKCETTGPTGLAIFDDVHTRHFAMLAEGLQEVVFRRHVR